MRDVIAWDRRVCSECVVSCDLFGLLVSVWHVWLWGCLCPCGMCGCGLWGCLCPCVGVDLDVCLRGLACACGYE